MGKAQVLSRRARTWASMLLPTAAALWGTGWGCGGVVTDSGRARDGDASVVGTGGAISFPGTGGSKPKPRSPTCGNGIIDGNELCDGTTFRSDVQSCQQALMNGSYYGTMGCTSSCTLDTSGCYSSGVAGTPNIGGSPVGGSFGFAGYAGGGGMLGFPPAIDCYSRGGVPDPASAGNCSFGVDATNACFGKPNRDPCADKCGCANCPNPYDRCETDGACFWLLACAQQNGCYSVSSCEQSGCSSFITTAGGPKTPSAALLDQVLSCFSANNCPLRCQ